MIATDLDIPGYDIEDLLGKGGMASVYKARQKSFGREVALKVFHANIGEDESFGQRFIQESLIVAKLHHSNIVQVYDVGQKGNHFYISMEYLHGGDLEQKITSGLTLKETVSIIKQAASALDFAHRKHIVHRDIKPENIMFREDNAVVLTDFGIAKELESQSNLTQTGIVIGTPKYMSPEQIRGDDVDQRTDIYALGIVFFRCLTNHVPFNGKDIIVTSYLQHNEPVPKLPAEVACFQEIIDRMLEKDVDQRYQHGREIVEALEEIRRDQYQPKLTNLDVATSSRHAPPTVTRSGSHTTTKVVSHSQAGPAKRKPPRAAGVPVGVTHMRPKSDFQVTVEAPMVVPDDMQMPRHVLDEQQKPAPRALNWLLSFAVIAAGGALTLNYWDEFSYWDKFTFWDKQPPTALTAPVVEKVQEQLILATVKAFTEADQEVDPTTTTNLYPQKDSALEEMDVSADSSPPDSELTPPQIAVDQGPILAGLALTEHRAHIEQKTPPIAIAEDVLISEDEPVPQDELVPLGNGVQEDNVARENDLVSADSQLLQEELDSKRTTISALLAEAEANIEQRRFTQPQSNNAFDKFQQVLALEPDNSEALAGIQAIAERYIRMADKAITEQRFENAKNYLYRARRVEPNLDAIASSSKKLSLALEAYQEMQALELISRRNAKIESLFAAAADDEKAGHIRAPIGDNALEKYQRILELDPDNARAIEKLVDFGR